MAGQPKPQTLWDEIPDWAYTIAKTLLQAMRERDPYTYGHCKRVAGNARQLAEAVNFSEREQQIVEFASMFHDLGKMGIPDNILLKPTQLTVEEEAIMRAHPLKSVEIISPLTHIAFFKAVIPGVRSHHERFDGSGYPDGIKGLHIPVAARLILIADTFDAMTTTRPYRKGLSFEAAYKELKTQSGKQFDPQFVAVFIKEHPQWASQINELTQDLIPSIKKAA